MSACFFVIAVDLLGTKPGDHGISLTAGSIHPMAAAKGDSDGTNQLLSVYPASLYFVAGNAACNVVYSHTEVCAWRL